MSNPDLHNQIMNLPAKCGYQENTVAEAAYKIGHRDARHAAAELVLPIATALEAAEGENERLRDIVRRLRSDAFRPVVAHEREWETEEQEQWREDENRERREKWDAATEAMLATAALSEVKHGE